MALANAQDADPSTRALVKHVHSLMRKRS